MARVEVLVRLAAIVPLPDLGQHLLTDDVVIARVVSAAALNPGDHVLDAGAGKGALTRPIAAAVAPGGTVWAVDVDPEMVAALKQATPPGVTIVEHDLLEWPLPATLTAVVANPPYKIAAPLIERVMEAGVERAVFVVPRELADRLAAEPGSEHYGKLTIRVGLHAKVEDLGYLSRRAFTPQPAVTSGLIRLRARSVVPEFDGAMLDAVIDAAWDSWERKTRHAFGELAHEFRCDGAALAALLVQTGWAELKVNTLPPKAFAKIARHLARGHRAE